MIMSSISRKLSPCWFQRSLYLLTQLPIIALGKTKFAAGQFQKESRCVDISIVIPAYNEEARIGRTLSVYAAELNPRYNDRWELLVVLNGCTDRTEGVVTAARRDCPAIHPLVYDEKLGKGGAILEGLRAATGDLVAFVDADNMVGPGETTKLLDALVTDEIAIGWRRLDLSIATEAQPWFRRLASLVLPLWARWFLRLPYHDPQCGAKAMRVDALKAMLPLLSEQGWALDLNMLMAARDLGLTVQEVPISWLHVTEGSKVHLPQASWEVFVATWRLKFKRRHPPKGGPG